MSTKTPRLIQRKRTKDWRMPEGTIYIGRPSHWANPYKISEQMTAAQSVKRYQAFIQSSLDLGSISLEPLRGKDLACWCGDWEPGKPEIDCHGVVLLKMANKVEYSSDFGESLRILAQQLGEDGQVFIGNTQEGTWSEISPGEEGRE